MRKILLALSSLAILAACSPAERADYVFTDGRIYTADGERRFVEAMAVKGDAIVYAGSARGAAKFAGKETKRIDLGGRLLLPGLHDAHIHPIAAMPVETCDLQNEPRALAEISALVADCIARMGAPEGEWFTVSLWNFAAGNQPGDEFSTMREALDAASTAFPIIALGSDGHHYAVNSPALARAKNAAGETVGFSAATLAGDFSAIAVYVGVDAAGEPNGRLTEDYALAALGAESILTAGMAARRAHPELLMKVTLPRGITSFLDAAADPETLDIYDALAASGGLHARATLALYLDPAAYAAPDGGVDYEAMMEKASAIREKYSGSDRIRATFLKLFADGVMEGDPLAVPPTLPNAALSRNYLQPVYEWDEDAEWVRVKEYVDPASPACAAPEGDIGAFIAANGFHPAQCTTNNGVLQYDEQTILDYIRAGDAAGFTFNIHAIGDRAVKTALDGIERAQRENGSARRHIVTHLQLVRPEDVARFSALGAYASFTFAWAVVDPQYDTTVIPFIDRVDGPGGFYDPAGYYVANAYPAESIRKAGATIIAGSDAPVDTIDPRPFVNIEGAVSRAIADEPPMNLNEALSIFDAVDAYTINAARALGQEAIAGSIEPGKKADFIILDQDIFALAETGEMDRIGDTKVLETWFAGKKVHEAGAGPD